MMPPDIPAEITNGINMANKKTRSTNENHLNKTSTKSGKIRYAIIGLGHIAQIAMLPGFQHSENSELVAIVSGNSEKRRKLCERYNLKYAFDYDELDDLFALNIVDAVYIALPNDMHCEYAVRAARAGLHVLCEKPMAVTEEQCLKMIRAADENNVHLMIAYRLHFAAAHLEAIQAARNGDLGELRLFTSTFSQNIGAEDIRLLPISEGGGSVYDMGIYCLNAARYLFGDEPIEVSATSASRACDPRFTDSDEMTCVMLKFPNDRLATFTSSFGAAFVSELRLVGNDGELVMNAAYQYAQPMILSIQSGESSRTRTFEKSDQFGPELIYFSNCILNNQTPEPDGYEGLADVRIIEAIYRSARTGQSIQLEPVQRKRRPDMSQLITRPCIEKPDEVRASNPKQSS